MDSQQQTAPASPPSAQVVGNAFVHQYYNILYQSPGLVHRFYQESSKLGRPGAHGMINSVTTLHAIDEKILSLDYGGLRAEIKTVDAQESLNGGVLVLVTGYITGKDNVRRNFTQSFFLATQDKGFFVLNDIFRYVEEGTEQQGNQDSANDNIAPHPVKHEAPQLLEEPIPEQSESPPEEDNVIEVVYNPSEHEKDSDVDEERPDNEVVDEVPNSSQAMAADSGFTIIQEEAPKKSYASIVKVMKENVAPLSVVATTARAVPSNMEKQAIVAPSQTPVVEVPSVSSSMPETANVQDSGVDGRSVYIKGLPLNATPADVGEEFKRFGAIKPGGVQVRSHKQQGFCFGFVEFEAASSVQSAIEASPVTIGGWQTSVEEKRPAGSWVSNRGRFSGRVGVFRNEGARGHGHFGYGRGDFISSGRGGGSSRGDSTTVVYKRVEHVEPMGSRGPRSGPKNLASRTST